MSAGNDAFLKYLEELLVKLRTERNPNPYGMTGMILKEKIEVVEEIRRTYLVTKGERKL